jgi:hypothetical protein
LIIANSDMAISSCKAPAAQHVCEYLFLVEAPIRFARRAPIWLDYGVGKQFCGWIEHFLKTAGPNLLSPLGLRSNVDAVISNLIRLGAPQATALETALLHRVQEREAARRPC